MMRRATPLLLVAACGFKGPTQGAPSDAVDDATTASPDAVGDAMGDAAADGPPIFDAAIDAGILPNFAFFIEAESYDRLATRDPRCRRGTTRSHCTGASAAPASIRSRSRR